MVDRRAAEAEGAVDQVVGEPLAAAKAGFVVGARVESIIVETGGRVPRRLLRVDEIAPVVDAGRRRIQHHRMGALGDINREAAGVARGVHRLDEEDDPRVDALRRNHGLPHATAHLRHLHRRGIGPRVVHRPAQAKTLDPVGVGRADLDPDLLTNDRNLGSLHEVGHHRAQVGGAGLQSSGDAVESPGAAEIFGNGELVGPGHLVLVAVGVERLRADMPLGIKGDELVGVGGEIPCAAIGALNPVDLIVASAGGDDLQGAGPVNRVSGGAPAAHMGSLENPPAGIRVEGRVHQALISPNNVRGYPVDQARNEAEVGAVHRAAVMNLHGEDILSLVEQLSEIRNRLLLKTGFAGAGSQRIMGG